MNFQQLRSVRETVRQGFNLTAVAAALHTSQPGVSRHIRELEDELGVQIFVRAGKRLTGLTAPGQALMPIVLRLLHDADDLRRAAADFASADRGTLTIAATHAQARYALPPVVRDFRARFPGVALRLHQGSPQEVAQHLLDGHADIGVATESLADHAELAALPTYVWSHCVVVPPEHALAQAQARGEPLNLAQLAAHPLITYEAGYSGRKHIDEAFARQDLRPQVVLSAMDADVIKTYAAQGLGVGLIAAIAFDEARDHKLRAIDARHLFASNTTRVAVRRGAQLRAYTFEFIQLFAAPLTRAVVEQAMAQPAGDSFDI